MDNQPKTRNKLIGAASILVSGGILAWLLWRLDWERARVLLSEARTGWLLAALLLACCLPLLATVRWMGVLRALQSGGLPFSGALRAVMTANALNSFLPSKAGDLVKAAYLRRQAGFSAGLGTVLLERLVDLGVLAILGILGSLASGVGWGLAAGLLLAGAVLAAFLVLSLAPGLGGRFLPGKLAQGAGEVRGVFLGWLQDPSTVALTLGASLCHWALAGLIVCSLLSAVGGGVSWAYAYSVFPLALLAGLVPVTIGGLGTRDAAFVALLGIGLPREEATLVALGYTLCSYWLLSLIGLPFAVLAVRSLRRER